DWVKGGKKIKLHIVTNSQDCGFDVKGDAERVTHFVDNYSFGNTIECGMQRLLYKDGRVKVTVKNYDPFA
ncbi:MAG: hypothetical protein V1836_00775, partial [Candidatus Aenigmatarchaeota archaeon]